MWSHDDEAAVAQAMYQYDHGPFRHHPWSTPAEAVAQHAYEARARQVLATLAERGWHHEQPTISA